MSVYPATVNEVLSPQMKFKPAALRAVRAFARNRPWSGSIESRKSKFRRLNHDLSLAYGIPEPELIFGHVDGTCSGASHYLPGVHQIVLTGKLSVVTSARVCSCPRHGGAWGVPLVHQSVSPLLP
jgi:hypothetical protein